MGAGIWKVNIQPMPKQAKIIDAHITSVTTETLVEDNSRFLDVIFDILQDDEVIATRKLGFPLDAPQEEIEQEVKKTAQGYKADLLLAESRKEQEETEAQAQEVIESLTNKEL